MRKREWGIGNRGTNTRGDLDEDRSHPDAVSDAWISIIGKSMAAAKNL
jgi:hypothetical protein